MVYSEKVWPKNVIRIISVLNAYYGNNAYCVRIKSVYADVPKCCIMVYKFQPQKLYYEIYDRDAFAKVQELRTVLCGVRS